MYKCAEADATLTTGCQKETIGASGDGKLSAGTYNVCYCSDKDNCNAAAGLKVGALALLAAVVAKMALA